MKRSVFLIFLCTIFVASAVNADVVSQGYVDEKLDAVKLEVNGAESKQNKNVANGYAGLNDQGKIDTNQIKTDSVPTQNSENMISSGAVWAEINSAWNEYY